MSFSVLMKIVVSMASAGYVISCASWPHNDKNGVPSWYASPPQSGDSLYGIGSAKLETVSLSRTIAVSLARKDIGRQANTCVTAALETFTRQIEGAARQKAVEVAKTVSRKIADDARQDARLERVRINDDGTVYVLAAYSHDALLSAVREELKNNSSAVVVGIRPTAASKRLEAELAEKSTSPSVSPPF